MVGAGLLAKRAVERGLSRRPWVKSSLAPGSKVVTEYLERAGLTQYLDELGFNLVGYGCTTCIGNSGPLPEPISRAVSDGDLIVCAVLSGNRNFEARIHSEVKANYLASPPLVVAYALAGRMDVDLTSEPLGQGADGTDVYLRDLWPSPAEIQQVIEESLQRDMFERTYADVFAGDERWNALPIPEGDLYAWEPASTYVRLPPYFDGMPPEPPGLADIEGARCLVMVGDSRYHRSHLPGRLDQARQPRRPLPPRPGRGAGRLQLVRLAARQPRGDGARHLRERPAQEPARPGRRGLGHAASAGRRANLHLRGVAALPRRGRPAGRARRQGVRVGLLPGLGGQGPRTARGEGGDRRELRADPPVEPAHDGNRPSAARGRGYPRLARPDGPRDVLRSPGSRTARRARSRSPPRPTAAIRSASRAACASTRPESATTPATAASSRSSCAASPSAPASGGFYRGGSGPRRMRPASRASTLGRCPCIRLATRSSGARARGPATSDVSSWSGERAHLEGRSPVDRWRSRWIRLEDISEVRIGRSEPERIAGRRSLVVELSHGPRFVISHLGGDDALHELADLLSAPTDGGRAA